MTLWRAAVSAVLLMLPLHAAAAGEAAPQAPKDETAPPATVAITWDREANIREVAERIGRVQRTQGAEAAMKLIDACYRTHGLASAYSAAFEGCIVQDYLESKLLVRIYSRLKPENLRKMGAPTAEAIGEAMGRRLVAAFNQYKIGTEEAQAIKTAADTHGLPLFLKTVFPKSADEIDALGGKAGGPDKSKEKN